MGTEKAEKKTQAEKKPLVQKNPSAQRNPSAEKNTSAEKNLTVEENIFEEKKSLAEKTPLAEKNRLAQNSPLSENPLGLGHAPRLSDLRLGRVLGGGQLSTVYEAWVAGNGPAVAVKAVEAGAGTGAGVEHGRRERAALEALAVHSSPLFVRLLAAFQEARTLYLVLALAPQGDLGAAVVRLGRLALPCVRFYAAELVLALEHLRALHIVHRDVKPSNVLLDQRMHIQLADFGSAKILAAEGQHDAPDIPEEELQHGLPSDSEEELEDDEEEGRRGSSFVGTAQYLSPEVLRGRRVSPATDLWALGATVHELAEGRPPFEGDDGEMGAFSRILARSLPSSSDPDAPAHDLVQALLVLNPSRRLGARDAPPRYTSLRDHPLLAPLAPIDGVPSAPAPPLEAPAPPLEAPAPPT